MEATRVLPTMSPTEAEMPEYVVDALSDQQRRAIVSYLSSADGAVSLRELADHLTSQEVGAGGPTRSSPPSKKLFVKLHHVQLPTLDEAGLVEYASEKRRVAYAGEWVLAEGMGVESELGREDSVTAGHG